MHRAKSPISPRLLILHRRIRMRCMRLFSFAATPATMHLSKHRTQQSGKEFLSTQPTWPELPTKNDSPPGSKAWGATLPGCRSPSRLHPKKSLHAYGPAVAQINKNGMHALEGFADLTIMDRVYRPGQAGFVPPPNSWWIPTSRLKGID